jgi:hypothetical protein
MEELRKLCREIRQYLFSALRWQASQLVYLMKKRIDFLQKVWIVVGK